MPAVRVATVLGEVVVRTLLLSLYFLAMATAVIIGIQIMMLASITCK